RARMPGLRRVRELRRADGGRLRPDSGAVIDLGAGRHAPRARGSRTGRVRARVADVGSSPGLRELFRRALYNLAVSRLDRVGDSPQQDRAQHSRSGSERSAHEKRDVVSAVSAPSWVSPEASRVSVREAARLARIAKPRAAPIMNDVLTTPDASPASLGSTSLIAASSTGLRAMPEPKPRRIMLGSTSTMKLPSTGARANSANPAAASSSPSQA